MEFILESKNDWLFLLEPITTAANIFIFIFIFKENKYWQADKSREMSRVIFSEKWKKIRMLSVTNFAWCFTSLDPSHSSTSADGPHYHYYTSHKYCFILPPWFICLNAFWLIFHSSNYHMPYFWHLNSLPYLSKYLTTPFYYLSLCQISVGWVTSSVDSHYENTPIQIYWKFYQQKKKENFLINILIFFIFLLKT